MAPRLASQQAKDPPKIHHFPGRIPPRPRPDQVRSHRRVDLEVLVNATIVRAHQHTTGARKGWGQASHDSYGSHVNETKRQAIVQ